MPDHAPTLLVVDAANVVGSRPTGWWRDRAGAARSLVARLHAAVDGGTIAAPVVVVLEGAARAAAPAGSAGAGIEVVHAAAAGDDTIVDVVAAAADTRVTVVTADRDLRARVQHHGAAVTGPTAFLDRLDAVDRLD